MPWTYFGAAPGHRIKRGDCVKGFLVSVSLVFLISLSVAVVIEDWDRSVAVSSTQEKINGIFILDAGHGGEDGGAVSISGVPESGINLAIAKKLDGLLGFYGVAPVLLRDQDISLHDADAITLREKKVSDLKNRVAAIQAVERATLISIHQNTYPDGRYHGTQAFYAKTDGSQELAQQIQNAIKMTIQHENKRDVKLIPNTVYIMNHIDCRAVLIECGFLTNPEEEALLTDENYQRKFASVLLSVLLDAGT